MILWTYALGTMMAMEAGRGFGSAATLATVNALGGLIAWAGTIILDAKTRPDPSRAEIRWLAILMTLWTCALGTMMAMEAGRGFRSAATLATVSALGGLIAWAVYHLISRRNGGLGIFFMALVGTWDLRRPVIPPFEEALTDRALAIVIMALVSVFGALVSVLFGLLARRHQKADGQPILSPLWDAEIDRPCPH
jgi:hypothetical protein